MQLHFKTRNCNLFKAQPTEEQAYIDSNMYFTSWVVCSPSMTGVYRYDIKKKMEWSLGMKLGEWSLGMRLEEWSLGMRLG